MGRARSSALAARGSRRSSLSCPRDTSSPERSGPGPRRVVAGAALRIPCALETLLPLAKEGAAAPCLSDAPAPVGRAARTLLEAALGEGRHVDPDRRAQAPPHDLGLQAVEALGRAGEA